MIFYSVRKGYNVKDETIEITEEPKSMKLLMLRTLKDGKVIYNEVHIDKRSFIDFAKGLEE